MNSVTITPVYRASGAGKRKGSIPLKTVPKSSLVQVEPVDLSLKKDEGGELVVDLSLRRYVVNVFQFILTKENIINIKQLCLIRCHFPDCNFLVPFADPQMIHLRV